MNKKILLDMDGVIVDFIEGICKYHKLENPYDKGEHLGNWDVSDYWKMDKETFWTGVSSIFWRDLNPYRDYADLINLCIAKVGQKNICLLTAPPMHNAHRCSETVKGKLQWLKDRGINLPVLFGEAKHFCAGADTILIDDADHNVDAFREAGGKAILVPRPWNTQHEVKLGTVEVIRSEWDKLHDSERNSGIIGTVLPGGKGLEV